MKVLALEFWAEPGTDKILIHSECLKGMSTSQVLRCLGHAIEETLKIAQAIAEGEKLPPGEMNKMMRAN